MVLGPQLKGASINLAHLKYSELLIIYYFIFSIFLSSNVRLPPPHLKMLWPPW